MSGLVVGLCLVGLVVALLAANYVAVTIQERRAGRSPGRPPVVDPVALADPQLVAGLRDGRKIEAIKRYRELTGVGLKEAKDAIDQAAARPGLPDRFDPEAWPPPQ